jgi:hypothetical protein
MYKCYVCGKIHEVDEYGIEPDIYEYRGVYSCAEHFDEMIEMRDFKRREIINEEDNKTKFFKGLDFSPDTPIGEANREIFKGRIEVAAKESQRLKDYEEGK